MEQNIYADDWVELLVIYITCAMVLICLAVSIWKAVARHFSLFWCACAILLTAGIGFILSPVSGYVPVEFWDSVVRMGQISLLVGMIAVIAGSFMMRRPSAGSR
jgi:hypothetical protein